MRRLALLPRSPFDLDTTRALVSHHGVLLAPSDPACRDIPTVLRRWHERGVLDGPSPDGPSWQLAPAVHLMARAQAMQVDPAHERAAALTRVVRRLWWTPLTAATRLLAPTRASQRLSSAATDTGSDTQEDPSVGDVFSGHAQAAQWLEEHLSTLVDLARALVEAGEPRVGWRLLHILWRTWSRIASPQWLLEHAGDQLLLEAAVGSGDTAAMIDSLVVLGEALTGQERHRDAERLLTDALRLAQHTADGPREAVAWQALGLLAQARGLLDHADRHLEEARTAFSSAVDIHERLGPPGDIAAALRRLGELHIALGDPHRALAVLTDATELITGSSDPYDDTETVHLVTALGRAHTAAGDLPAADVALTSALHRARALTGVTLHGREGQDLHARILYAQGELALAGQDPDTAHDRLTRAAELYRRALSPDLALVQDLLGQLDRTHGHLAHDPDGRP